MPSHWEGEDAIITFEEEGKDTVTNYQAKIVNISKSGGASNTDEVHTFGGATINFQKPREKFTMSMEVIFADTTFDYIHFGSHEGVPASGTEMRSSAVPTRWRITCWFVPHADHVTSGTTTVPPKSGPMYRWVFTDCKCVSFDQEFSSDEYLKGTLTWEYSATDGNGYANEFREYTASQTTTALTVLNSTAHKGALTWATTTPAWTGSYRT